MAEPHRRLETPLLLLGLAAAVALVALAASWSLRLHALWFGPMEGAIVAALIVCAGVASFGVLSGRVGVRVWLAALMSLGPAIQSFAEISGHGLSYALWEDERIAVLCALACAVGAIGLVLRKSWARWLALAAAIGGVGTAGLNIFDTLLEPRAITWIYAMSLGFSTIVGLSLAGPSVREAFETQGADGVWSSRDPVVRGIRLTVLSTLVAAPMLLVYAWVQPIVPLTRTPALVLAVVLGLGALLSMGRKVLGAILLTLGGPALLILAAVTAWFAYAGGELMHLRIAGYYACFWGPAGLISTLTGLAMIKPVWQLWSRLES